MEKPILATNIDGFLIKHAAFIEPHKAWFDRVIRLTGDKSLEKWKGRKDYFAGVDIAMKKLMPDSSEHNRVMQARKWYQEDVVFYIQEHPEVVYKNVAEMLKKLKRKFTLALITTNSEDYIKEIIKAAKIEGIYNIVFAIPLSEKPDKSNLFKRFVQKYGNPYCYIAARSKEAFEECKKIGSICIYASWDEYDKEIAKLVKNHANSIDELEFLYHPETY